ncbi:hypothetical protein [Streptomyces sp. NPDC047525]|uniref:hypothetical protein n=1 Tax=Streptomyces sp. NPDC047525 TaxID=3155264 RepID=UPI0033E7E21F
MRRHSASSASRRPPSSAAASSRRSRCACSVDTGWDNNRSSIGYQPFICYCHGDRTDAVLADWVYVLKPDGVDVCTDISEDGTAAWQLGIFSPWPQLRRTPAPETFEEIVEAGLSLMYRAVVRLEQQT